MKKSNEKPVVTEKSRRAAMGKILAAGGVVGASQQLNAEWVKPVVNSIVMPVHAMTTGSGGDPGAGTTPVPSEPPAPSPSATPAPPPSPSASPQPSPSPSPSPQPSISPGPITPAPGSG